MPLDENELRAELSRLKSERERESQNAGCLALAFAIVCVLLAASATWIMSLKGWLP